MDCCYRKCYVDVWHLKLTISCQGLFKILSMIKSNIVSKIGQKPVKLGTKKLFPFIIKMCANLMPECKKSAEGSVRTISGR